MDHDLTRAAQARRRQRVAMNNNSQQPPPPPPQQHQVDTRTIPSSDNSTTTTTTSSSSKNAVNLMNRSMDAGVDAASLLASIRKEKQKLLQLPGQLPGQVVPLPSQQSPPLLDQIDTVGSETTTTTTPTSSYFMSMLSLQPPPNDDDTKHNQNTATKPSSTTITASKTVAGPYESKHPKQLPSVARLGVPTTSTLSSNHNNRVKFTIDSSQSKSQQLPTSSASSSSSSSEVAVAADTLRNHPTTTTEPQIVLNDSNHSICSHRLVMAPLSISAETTTNHAEQQQQQQQYNNENNHRGRQQQSPSILYDSTCITNHSRIRIQSHAYPTQTMAAATMMMMMGGSDKHNNDDDEDRVGNRNNDTTDVSATLNGNFLQDSIEILQIVRVTTTTTNDPSSSTNDTTIMDDDVIHFGDTVSLYWSNNSDTSISSTTTINALTCCQEGNATTSIQFRPLKQQRRPTSNHSTILNNKSQLWKILSPQHNRSSSNSNNRNNNNPILVGRAALEEDAIQRLSHHATNNGIGTDATTTTKVQNVPVHIGDPIVFRNCATGGILSSSCHGNHTGHLQILTDATFQPQIDITEEEMDEDTINDNSSTNHHGLVIAQRDQTTLLSRLQQSGKLIPSLHEIFSLAHHSLPMIPIWMNSHFYCFDPNHQHQLLLPQSLAFTTASYMDMSYLLYPDRHETMHDMAVASFRLGVNIDTTAMDDRKGYTTTGTDKGNERFITIQQQEQILLYELINACMGLEGTYIRAVLHHKNNKNRMPSSPSGHDMDQIQFHLHDDVHCRWDVIVRELIEGMVLLPTLFVRMQYFLHRHTPGYEYGQVMQAFCDRLGQLVHDHIGMVVSWHQQYTDGRLTLTKFQTQIHVSMHTLSILNEICQVVQSHKGGSLINAIRRWQRQSSNGDTESETLVQSLLDAATVPFMKRLVDWLQMGILVDDLHLEFMIEKSNEPNISWENQYLLSKSNVLEGFFATEQLVEQALATGRYWNAVRSSYTQCRSEVIHPTTSDVPTTTALHYSSSASSISEFIQTNHHDASRALLRLLMNDFDLLHVLRTMKQYFLLEHGDFFVNFLDCAEEELLKDVTQLSRMRLQHWIDSCRQTLDQNIDDRHVATKSTSVLDGLRCRISSDGLADYLDKLHAASGGIDTKDAWTPMRHTYGGTLTSTKSELTGLDTFFLDLVAIPFPISTVLSSSAMGCYHLLFRHLFFAKYVERRMVSIWKDHQMMKELKSLRGPMGATFLLRQRMLHLLQNLIYYMMFEVIEPSWLIMEKAISSPTSTTEQTVDDILHDHSNFLQRTLEACLLTNRDVVRALTKLLKTCLLFSEQMKRFMKASKLEEERCAVATEKQKAGQHEFYSRFTKRTSENASTKHLQENFRRNRSERQDRVQRQSARIEREVSGEPFRRMIIRFEEVFTKNLRDFMIQINNSDDIFHTHKVNLCIRLDYNGYITSSLGLV